MWHSNPAAQIHMPNCKFHIENQGYVLVGSIFYYEIVIKCLTTMAGARRWKYVMITSSNGNIFRVTGHLCGEFAGHRWIPFTWPVTRSFVVFFDLCLNERLSKQSWGRWFETPSRPLRHSNEFFICEKSLLLPSNQLKHLYGSFVSLQTAIR